ncbi:hypothetical protein ACW0Q9_28150, partial [Micromonospora sp. I033]
MTGSSATGSGCASSDRSTGCGGAALLHGGAVIPQGGTGEALTEAAAGGPLTDGGNPGVGGPLTGCPGGPLTGYHLVAHAGALPGSQQVGHG